MPLEYAVVLHRDGNERNTPLLEGTLVCLKWPGKYDVDSHRYHQGRPAPYMKKWDQSESPEKDGWTLAGVLVSEPLEHRHVGLFTANIAATGAWRIRDCPAKQIDSIWNKSSLVVYANNTQFAVKLLKETWGGTDGPVHSISLCCLNIP